MRAVAIALLFPLAISAQQPAPPILNGGLPAVHPKTSQIAFISNRDGQHDIYIANADGDAVRRLTNDAARKSPPSWGSNGTEILFASGARMDSMPVYAISVTGDSKRVVSSTGGPGRPSLSNNGQWIAVPHGEFAKAKLAVSRIDGSNLRLLTDGKTPAFDFAWSPDDKQLAYTTMTMDSARVLSIWVVNADGTDARRVSQIPANEGSPQWPAWSPDGKRLAIQVGKYSRDRATNTAHIWLIDVASGRATKLAAHDRAYLDETPSWFPDGRRLAFQSNRTGRMEIWVMNDDGTGARQVTK